ncbi:MAG: hypothetical protein CBB87_03900 [Micavibrio sp. TMED27]|nr:hypothetical protein [Micavibrio sp.]OUT91965.1 MAG: hypothetical protein CBB87_03900 [Micavibrio sp. TMED27]|tara:strand:- start:340 stop:789 length:450 start_codon:yes stop_codon:yes gene_type:complete
MRHGSSNSRRQRGRGGNNRRSNQRTQVFDSNGPDVRIRGTAHQVTEKYMALAKDAAAAGDRIMAESYLQHAEHYQRIINSWDDGVNEQPQRKARNQNAKSDDIGNTVEAEAAETPAAEAQVEDLSLPTSILGEEVKASGGEQEEGEVVA